MGLLCLWAVSGSCKLLALTQLSCPRQRAGLCLAVVPPEDILGSPAAILIPSFRLLW